MIANSAATGAGAVAADADAQVAAARAKLDAFLAAVRKRVAQRRILVRPLFRDFDRHSRGFIEPKCVIQALASMGLQCSRGQLSELMAGFPCKATGHGFDYLAFVDAVDPHAAAPGEAVFAAAAEYGAVRRPAPSRVPAPSAAAAGLDLLMSKICKWVNTRRIRLSEFVRDPRFPTRHMSASRFKSALSMAGICLTEPELELLCSAYAGSDAERVNHALFHV